MEDLYAELELSQDCSFEEIKQQFRTLARKYHPDLGGDAEKFKKIKLAYEVLSDPIRREEYNKTGNTQTAINIRQEAMNNLSQIFFGHINAFDPSEQKDLIENIKLDIKNSREVLENQKTNIEEYSKKLELIRSKIRRKDDSIDETNILISFLDNMLENKNTEIKGCNTKTDIANKMLEILDNYSYGYMALTSNTTISEGGGFKHNS